MARFLFAWELGANFGHLTRDLPIAERLREMGHEVAFAVRDTAIAAQLLLPRGFGFVQAPWYWGISEFRAPLVSYADILISQGFTRADEMIGRVKAWDHLFDLVRPDLVVADHAPTALVAAWISAQPAVAFGTGFTIPPRLSPFPAMRTWETVDRDLLVESERKVLSTLESVSRALAGRCLEQLSDLFGGGLLATFPELDHYKNRGESLYTGAMRMGVSPRQLKWPDRPGCRVLAYLRPSMPGFHAALNALTTLRSNVVTVAPGATYEETVRFEAPGHVIFRSGIGFDELVSGAEVVVCYGGMGLIEQSLLAGVPVLLLPQTTEQVLGARRVVELGAGRMLGKERSIGNIRNALFHLIENEKCRLAARAFAGRYRIEASGSVERVCAALLRGVGRSVDSLCMENFR